MKTKSNEYFLGLDVGSGSVGWAVTDNDYSLLRCNKKDLWGVRLFETAETAESRRLHRGMRRRINRRHQRLVLLQELFAEEISKCDAGFFLRLKESAFYKEDKTIEQINSLFNDKDFTDRTYHHSYPTIHHLVKALINGTVKKDIRLLYLACHNIIKKRGHFLFPGEDFHAGTEFNTTISALFEYLREDMEIDLDVDVNDVKEFLKDKSLNRSERKKKLESLFNLSPKDRQKKEIIKLISGLKYSFDKLYNDEELKEIQPNETAFSKIDFYAKADEFASLLGERFELILRAKAVYDASVLSKIMGDDKFLSFAKVKTYEKHKKDLVRLKSFIKKHHSNEDYNKIFRTEKLKDNYCNYIGMCKINGKKRILDKKATQEDFYKFIKKIINYQELKNQELKNDEDFQYILKEIGMHNFLPRQVDKKNSEIPYQLRKAELVDILNNAEKTFPFLKTKDNSGLSVKEKIIKLLTFKIPYYVGIVNDSHKQQFPDRCWVVKKETGKGKRLTPWTFFDIVDKEKTAQAFITSRTNKCTYLIGEDVLPRNSFLYSEFTVLNEINNLKIYINGKDIFSTKLKHNIFNQLFKEKKKVTRKQIEKFILTEGLCTKDDTILITGIDEECTSSLGSYIDLRKIFKGDIEKQHFKDMLENIILWSTIYDEGDGKDMLEAKIKKHYPNVLSAGQLKKILAMKFSGWARFSKKFLTEITAAVGDSMEGVNIITALRSTNFNLMEVLGSSYEFAKEIDLFNSQFQEDKPAFSYNSLVKDLYVSPSVKRMIWQTLRIVKEIKTITKKDPQKIFIEMARGSSNKKVRTKSRKTILTDLYKNLKSNPAEWYEIKESLSQRIDQTDNLELRSDRLYLYYTQFGKCMYCDESIQIENIFNTKSYDIDHIYPQSKIKDDSLNNRVLVCGKCNQDKKDGYPLSQKIQRDKSGFWNFLHSHKFITREKLSRLIRTTELSYDEMGAFIARQLVETRQATKAAGKILETIFPASKIVYVKARNVSLFRQKFDILKCREINDLHHAHDAYLNIVVGNVYYTKFTNDPRNFIKQRKDENSNDSYNFYRTFDYDVERNNVVAWENNRTIIHVKKILNGNAQLYTRQAYCKHGGLFDQMIIKKTKGKMPLKAAGALSNTVKYGAYNKISAAYYILVEYEKKKKLIRSLEIVPLHLVGAMEKDPSVLRNHLKEILKVEDFTIILPKIKINALIKMNGFPYHIKSKTNNRFSVSSAVQFFCDYHTTLFFKRILKFNSVKASYDRVNSKKETKKYLTAYEDYTLLSYVKDSLLGKAKESYISKKEFEDALKVKALEVYDLLANRYKTSIYKNRLTAAPLADLGKTKNNFINLSMEEQLFTIQEILKFFRPINDGCNMELLGGKKIAGKTTIGKSLSNLDECILISQSVTGVFEKKVDLLNL